MSATHAYRRCHVCGAVCEGASQVKSCSACGKPFAPFYYFNDRFTPIQGEGSLRPPNIEGQWKPLQGLTAYWQAD